MGAVAGVAIAMGPIVGGWLLEHFSWASIFIAMAPVAAAAAFVVALVVPTSKDPQAAAPDIPGLVLSSATMALLVFTIIEAPAYGWTAVRSLAGFAASAVLLAAFIVRERRAAHPMLDVRLFRNLRFSAASAAVTVSFFTLFGFIFLMTEYFQFVRGYGPLSAGVHLLPVALSVGAGSVAGTQLAVRAGTKLIVTTGLVAMARFYGWVAATTSTTIGYDVIAAQMVLYGLGMGLTSAPATESIMGAISAAGRRRLGHERLHPAHRRHARRGGDRQRVRIGLRITADRHAARQRARPGRGDRPPVRRRGLRGRLAGIAALGHSGPGTGAAARLRQRVPARPDCRLPRRRRCRRRAGAPPAVLSSRPPSPSSANPDRPASEPGRPINPQQPKLRTEPRPKRTPPQLPRNLVSGNNCPATPD